MSDKLLRQLEPKATKPWLPDDETTAEPEEHLINRDEGGGGKFSGKQAMKIRNFQK